MPDFSIADILARGYQQRKDLLSQPTGFSNVAPALGQLGQQAFQVADQNRQRQSVLQAQQDYAKYLATPPGQRDPMATQSGIRAGLALGIQPPNPLDAQFKQSEIDRNTAYAKALENKPVKPVETEAQKLDRIKKEAQARAEGSGTLDQKTQGEWDKLVRLSNPATATRGSLLGVAGVNNARADRALTSLKDPNMVVQQLDAVTADVAGIMKGGSPDEQGAAQMRFSNILTRWAALKSTLTSTPQAINNPAVANKLKQIVKDIKNVDNKIISDNFKAQEQAFKPIIAKDPQRWNEYKKSVMEQTVAPDETPDPGGTSHPQDSEAVAWAKANPNDPRAKQILSLNAQ